MKLFEYTTKNIEEVLEELKTSKNGLSSKEAENRLKTYGFNEIKVKEIGVLDIFLRQFKSPFFYLLFIAALTAFLVGEKINAFIILIFILINITLGFFQEKKATKTAALLKKYIPLKVRVKRGGKEKIIEQRFLVPGDIVLLEAGNIVPADIRLIGANDFLVDEEILTGESSPVNKNETLLLEETKDIFKTKNIVFTASSIVSGYAEGVVLETGKKTFFGEIAKLTAENVKESTYEKNMLKFSNIILKIVIFSITAVFVVNFIIKGTHNFFDFLIFCIALIVSIIPEALPAVITFALSQGALKMAKDKVVVKRLSSIEDLGDIEILCTDKTGTLTENKLSLEGIFSEDKERCLLYGLLSLSPMKEGVDLSQNSFDVAIFKKTSPTIRKAVYQFKKINEIPFNSNRLRSSALFKNTTGEKILIVKGAPEVILKLSSRFEEKKNPGAIEEEIKKEGAGGKRILAIGYKNFDKEQYSQEDEKDLKFLGYFSFSDPLKKTAKEAVNLAEKLGVKIKILTGDSFEVAGVIGKEIGLINDQNEVISGEKLENLNEEEFFAACEKFHVFARISPQTKFKIMEALKKKFEVGFLGEGINDAPSLKIANVAIAVRSGADISMEVSDIILLKKDLRVIVDGIKNGRNIFSNINKYIKCTLASNFGNFYSIATISFFIPFLPMLPIQILFVNLLSDFPLIAVASDSVDTEELKRPKSYQLSQNILLIILLAMVSTTFDFIFFGIFHKVEPSQLQTLWFIESILTEIALIFSIRTRYFFLKTKRPGPLLVILSFLTLIITIYLPFSQIGKKFFYFVSPPPFNLLIIFFLIIGYFIISEAVKLFYFKYWYNR